MIRVCVVILVFVFGHINYIHAQGTIISPQVATGLKFDKNLQRGFVNPGDSLSSIVDAYRVEWKSKRNKDISNVTDDQIATMIVDLNYGKKRAFHFNDNDELVLKKDSFLVTAKPKAVTENTIPVNDLINKLANKKVKSFSASLNENGLWGQRHYLPQEYKRFEDVAKYLEKSNGIKSWEKVDSKENVRLVGNLSNYMNLPEGVDNDDFYTILEDSLEWNGSVPQDSDGLPQVGGGDGWTNSPWIIEDSGGATADKKLGIITNIVPFETFKNDDATDGEIVTTEKDRLVVVRFNLSINCKNNSIGATACIRDDRLKKSLEESVISGAHHTVILIPDQNIFEKVKKGHAALDEGEEDDFALDFKSRLVKVQDSPNFAISKPFLISIKKASQMSSDLSASKLGFLIVNDNNDLISFIEISVPLDHDGEKVIHYVNNIEYENKGVLEEFYKTASNSDSEQKAILLVIGDDDLPSAIERMALIVFKDSDGDLIIENIKAFESGDSGLNLGKLNDLLSRPIGGDPELCKFSKDLADSLQIMDLHNIADQMEDGSDLVVAYWTPNGSKNLDFLPVEYINLNFQETGKSDCRFLVDRLNVAHTIYKSPDSDEPIDTNIGLFPNLEHSSQEDNALTTVFAQTKNIFATNFTDLTNDLSDDILIVTAHHADGMISGVGNGLELSEIRNIENINNSVLIANFCDLGSSVYTPSDLISNGRFSSLIFSFRKIGDMMAANYINCAHELDSKMQPGEGNCISIMEWHNKVKSCIQEKADPNDPNHYYHFMGDGSRKVCKSKST